MAVDRNVVRKAALIIGNDQGFVMVMALMMMVILLIVGGASMMVRNTEQQIVTNTEVMQHNFYALEAVMLEGATAIENTDDAILLNPALFPAWLKPNPPAPPPTPVLDLSFNNQWPNAVPPITPQETSLTVDSGTNIKITPDGYAPDTTSAGDRIWYAAVQGNHNSDIDSYEICKGADLSESEKEKRCYSVYGMYDVKSGAGKSYTGKRLLMAGYKKTVYLPE